MYDYVIVGAGLFGCVAAHELCSCGKKVVVIDKRPHIGGNVYCESIEGINVHKYGAHIFHTSDKQVWDYVNRFVSFNRYTNSPVANYKGQIYNLPFNMNTFNRLWGVVTPEQAKAVIEEQRKKYKTDNPKNLEEQAINLVGIDIYEKLIKGYTEKQWGRSCKELPAFIIKRLPVRFIYDNNYFNDIYQGIPEGGYNVLTEKLLKGAEIVLNEDFLDKKDYYMNIGKKIIYTGRIDAFYDYIYGELDYRSLEFETRLLDIPNYQGNAVVNYTDRETPYTRIIEHKHFEFGAQSKTVITYEYPKKYEQGAEPYYPVNDEKNQSLYSRYAELAKKESRVVFGGRLGEYKYYDMDKVIKSALELVEREI